MLARILVFLSIASLLVACLPTLEGRDKKKKDPDAAKKDDDKKPDDKKPQLKATVNGLEFEVVKSKINGNNWEMSVAVVSPDGDTTLRVSAARAYTDDGKVFAVKFGAFNKKSPSTKVPAGQKVQMQVSMGQIPNSVKMLSTVEVDFAGKKKNTVAKFKNVAVER
jgi:hypothetical protein